MWGVQFQWYGTGDISSGTRKTTCTDFLLSYTPNLYRVNISDKRPTIFLPSEEFGHYYRYLKPEKRTQYDGVIEYNIILIERDKDGKPRPVFMPHSYTMPLAEVRSKEGVEKLFKGYVEAYYRAEDTERAEREKQTTSWIIQEGAKQRAYAQAEQLIKQHKKSLFCNFVTW